MQNGAGPLLSSAVYDQATNPTKRTIGTGAGARVQQWCWDKGHTSQQVLALAATGANALGVDCTAKTVNDHGVPAQLSHAITYVRDPEGKPQQRTESYLDPITNLKVTKTATYLHDPMDRLTSESYAGAATSYVSDVRDNLTTNGSVTQCYGTTVTCTAGATASKPQQVSSTSAGDKFLYDLAGNVRQWRRGADTYDYVYDADDRVTQVMRNNVVVANMLYDEEGKRVEKAIVNGPRTDYASDGYRDNDVGGAPSLTRFGYAFPNKIANPMHVLDAAALDDELGSVKSQIKSQGKIVAPRSGVWGSSFIGFDVFQMFMGVHDGYMYGNVPIGGFRYGDRFDQYPDHTPAYDYSAPVGTGPPQFGEIYKGKFCPYPCFL